MSFASKDISQQIEDLVEGCKTCTKYAPHKWEPLMSTPLSEHPWQKVVFHLKGKTYLIVVDYFSRYLEVVLLQTTTSISVVNALKAIFSRHGVPEILMTDNGPQF